MSGKLLLVVALALSAGCQRNEGECVQVASLKATLQEPDSAAGWHAKLESCLGRWGYSLAKTEGAPNEVAPAVLGGCQEALEQYAASATQEAQINAANTLKYADALASRRRDALEKAAFYVAVGRAGGCKRPIE